MKRPDPIPALTGLRIFGAAWVVLFHFQGVLYDASSSSRILEPLLAVGSYGVPLFFLLSGYIIWHNYGSSKMLSSPRELVRFIWRRFARLWPVNLLALVLTTPLIWFTVTSLNYWGLPVPGWYSITGWLGSGLMLNPLADSLPSYSWNQPAWTLTAEMVAYFMLPIILIVATRIKSDKLRWVALPLGVLVAASTTMGVNYPYRWLVDLLITFVAGVLLRIAGRPTFAPRVLAVVQIVAPIGIVVACYTGFNVFAVTPLLAIWVWSLSAPTGAVVSLFTTKPLQLAGLSSYSLYMVHWPLFGYASLLALYLQPAGIAKDLYVLATLVLVAVAAWACWRFFETPARRLLNLVFERFWPGKGKLTASEEVLEHDAGVEPHAHSHRPVESADKPS